MKKLFLSPVGSSSPWWWFLSLLETVCFHSVLFPSPFNLWGKALYCPSLDKREKEEKSGLLGSWGWREVTPLTPGHTPWCYPH